MPDLLLLFSCQGIGIPHMAISTSPKAEARSPSERRGYPVSKVAATEFGTVTGSALVRFSVTLGPLEVGSGRERNLMSEMLASEPCSHQRHPYYSVREGRKPPMR